MHNRPQSDKKIIQSSVASASSTRQLITLKICQDKSKLTQYDSLRIWSSDTINELKEEAARQSSISLSIEDFFLEIFDEINEKWEKIDNSDDLRTLGQTKLCNGSLITIRTRKKRQSHGQTLQNMTPKLNQSEDLTLKVCKKPFEDFEFLPMNINISSTLGKLRKQAYGIFEKSSENRYIYRRDEDVWRKFSSDMDGKTLYDLSFQNNQIISIDDNGASTNEKRSCQTDVLELKLCKTKHNRVNYDLLEIKSSNTLEKLKEIIKKELSIDARLKDFYLEMFDENNEKWKKIDDSNACKTLDQTKLRNGSLLAFTICLKEVSSSQSTGKSISDSNETMNLNLKLCEKPMDRTNFTRLMVKATLTLGELRRQVYENFNKSSNHQSILKRNTDGWIGLRSDMDEKTLYELGIKSNDFISRKVEKEELGTISSPPMGPLKLKLCKNKRSQTNHVCIDVWSGNTIKEVKEKIAHYLHIDKPIDAFFLEMYDSKNHIWNVVDDSNPSLTMNQLNIDSFSLLNVEYGTCKISNEIRLGRSTSLSYENHDLHLKLCKKPMHRTECYDLVTDCLCTIGDLRKQAYEKFNKPPKNQPIYKWDKEDWVTFDSDMDDMILYALSFQSDQYISTCIDTQEVSTKIQSNISSLELKVCNTKHNRTNYKILDIQSSDTLRTLKEKLADKFSIHLPLRDFFLELYNENNQQWEMIDESKPSIPINQLNIHDHSLVSIEHHTAQVFDDQSSGNITLFPYKNHELRLKLCKKPMDRTECYDLVTDCLCTIGDLRKQAYEKFNKPPKNQPIYKWSKNGWLKLESDMDDRLLEYLSFESSQYISIDYDDDDDDDDDEAFSSKAPSSLCGLVNLDNTCFMNSVFQCLINIPNFKERILQLDGQQTSPIISEYRDLTKKMCSGKYKAVKPLALVESIHDSLPVYQTYRQQDAQEFMNHFLNLIHAEFSMKKTIITDIFYGLLRSTVKCLTCQQSEINDEPLSFLPLPVVSDTEKYIRYIKTHGEQLLVPVKVDSSVVCIDNLIKCFIRQHEPTFTDKQICATQLVRDTVINIYESQKRLCHIYDEELAFLEAPKKTNKEIHIWCEFKDYDYEESFRPPTLLVCPDHNCYFLNISEQIDQILGHLCSVTNAPLSACSVYWKNLNKKRFKLDIQSVINKQLPNIKTVEIVLPNKWTNIYRKHYRDNHLTKKSTLKMLLVNFFREDYLDGDYHCSKCSKLTLAQHKSELCLPLPKVLIIQLKRFTCNINSNKKIDTYISFPLEDLDLREFTVEGNSDASKKRTSTIYDLVAVSNHTGSLTCGHYTTYAKNSQNANWYLFDDSKVAKLSSDTEVVTKNAYILVYLLRT